MPKVLRIINRFNLGGPTYNAAYLTRYLKPEFNTFLLGGSHEKSEASSQFILEGLDINFEILPEMQRSISPVNDYYAYQKICKYIHAFKPDIVHTHAAKAGALGRLAAIRNKVPVIVHTFHGHVLESYFSPVKNKIFTGIEKKLATHTSRIIALSQQQKVDLERILNIRDSDKIRIIPLGFDLSRFREGQAAKRKIFRERFNLEDDTLAIGIVGRLVPIKNQALFITALKFLQERTNRKVRAYIIGDGEERATLEKMAKEKGILFSTPYVEQHNALLTFTSWIKEMDIVMAGLDIIALTSLNEGTPVSLIEAQAAGVPIVSTRVGGIDDVVVQGKTALLSEVGDQVTFCKNLLLMTEDDTMRKGFSEKGWDHVRERYHYTRLVEDTRDLYRELLEVVNKV